MTTEPSEAAPTSPGRLLQPTTRARATAVRTFVLLALFATTGIVLLAGAALFSDDRILEQLAAAEQRGVLADSWSKTGTGVGMPTEIDCDAISYGTVSPKDASVFEEAVGVYRSAGCPGLREQIERYVSGAPTEVGEPYLRYWRGDSAFSATLVALVGVTGLRAFSQLLVLTSFSALGLFVANAAGWRSALMLLLPVVLTIPLETLSQSSPHAFSTAAGMFGAVAVAKTARAATAETLWFVSFSAGAVFAYLDVLTWVPGIWATVIVVTGLPTTSQGTNIRQLFRRMSIAGLGWSFGYGAMWATKWPIAGLVFGWNRVWNDVTGQIVHRVRGGGPRVSAEFGAALEKTIGIFLDRPFAWLLCLLCAGIAVRSIREWSRSIAIHRALLTAPILIIPLWFELLSQHSQGHPHFVYRSVSIGLGLAMMVITARVPEPHTRRDATSIRHHQDR